MKRVIIASLILISSLALNVNTYAAKAEVKRDAKIEVKDAERAKALNDRLLEIKKMDKSNLTAAERKELRSEVKTIKQDLTELSGGVYLSIGAIIVILLLLLLLL